MFTMASDRHYSSHPLPERSAPLLTLPSVAELLASSRPPSSDSISARQHLHHSAPRFTPPANSSSHSSPPSVSSAAPAANGHSASDPSFAPTLHHASQASPSDSTTSTSPSDQHYYHQSFAPPAKTQFSSSLSSLSSQSTDAQQDTAYSQPPINPRRQDSAVSQHPPALPSDLTTCHSHRSPNGNRQSTSPRLSDHSSNSPSSVHHSASTYSSLRGHARSSSATYSHVEGSKPQEVIASAASATPAQQDPTHTNHTRQSRYNVRFAANHTPDNMPSFPKPRQDRPPTPLTAEASAPEHQSKQDPSVSKIEPAIEIMKSAHNEQPSQPRLDDSTSERCLGCGATWSRPLPEKFSESQQSMTFGQGSLDMLTKLQLHGEKADASYKKWRWEHSHCVQNGNGHRNRSSSPYYTPGSEHSHSRVVDGSPRGSDVTEAASNKRKASDSPREEDYTTSKQRKVAAGHSSHGAPPVLSSVSR